MAGFIVIETRIGLRAGICNDNVDWCNSSVPCIQTNEQYHSWAVVRESETDRIWWENRNHSILRTSLRDISYNALHPVCVLSVFWGRSWAARALECYRWLLTRISFLRCEECRLSNEHDRQSREGITIQRQEDTKREVHRLYYYYIIILTTRRIDNHDEWDAMKSMTTEGVIYMEVKCLSIWIAGINGIYIYCVGG